MTDLQKMYLSARKGGQRKHWAAIKFIAADIGLDPETVQRSLDRAKKADEHDARRAERKSA